MPAKVRKRPRAFIILNLIQCVFEIIEFELSQTSSFSYQQIKNLKLPKETLIIHVTRGETNMIPHGALALEPNDHIVLIAKKNSSFTSWIKTQQDKAYLKFCLDQNKKQFLFMHL